MSDQNETAITTRTAWALAVPVAVGAAAVNLLAHSIILTVLVDVLALVWAALLGIWQDRWARAREARVPQAARIAWLEEQAALSDSEFEARHVQGARQLSELGGRLSDVMPVLCCSQCRLIDVNVYEFVPCHAHA